MRSSSHAYHDPGRPSGLHALPAGRCFLGMSNLAAADEAVWLTRAFGQLLPRHDGVLVLLEAEIAADEAQVTNRILDRWHEVDTVRRRLGRDEQARVQIAAWPHFADATFEALRNRFIVAFSHNTVFRSDVLREWSSLQRLAPPHGLTPQGIRTECLRQIESLAMALRVGELSGHPVEYGRGAESFLACQLYSGAYAGDGLTVESLIGQPPRRVYRRLA
ncbi:MAG: hypothetical protein HYV19_13625 [Gemmatimonadetes bacterium]|nr:hypothetical protein [Gemmatimonadota bacterium]